MGAQETSGDNGKTSGEVLHVRESDERRIVLEKLNNERFVRTGRQMIEACDLHLAVTDLLSNLHELHHDAKKLAQKQGGRVKSVCMIPRSGTVHLFFITNGEEYDFELADRLAEMNLKLRRESKLYGDVEATQLPAGEVTQFLSADEIDQFIN